MFKSIIVHIGAGKTGTSAIQTFLRLNAEKLQSKGYLVGDRSLEGNPESRGNQVWFFETMRADVQRGRQIVNERVAGMADKHTECHTLILSAENLSNSNGHESLFQDLASESEITVVFYVRRQDDFLLSAWQQWYAKENDDFDAWWRGCRHLADWKRVCQKWEAVVGRRAMQIRVYDPGWFVGGTLFSDFLTACGYSEVHQDFAIPNASINASFSDAVTELIRGKAGLFNGIHDNDFYDLIKDLTGAKYKRRAGETFVSISRRNEIVEAYAECNQWIRDRYFPHVESGQPLFRAVSSENLREVSMEDIEKEKSEIVLSLIKEMHRRLSSSQSKFLERNATDSIPDDRLKE